MNNFAIVNLHEEWQTTHLYKFGGSLVYRAESSYYDAGSQAHSTLGF